MNNMYLLVRGSVIYTTVSSELGSRQDRRLVMVLVVCEDWDRAGIVTCKYRSWERCCQALVPAVRGMWTCAVSSGKYRPQQTVQHVIPCATSGPITHGLLSKHIIMKANKYPAVGVVTSLPPFKLPIFVIRSIHRTIQSGLLDRGLLAPLQRYRQEKP